MKVKFDLLLTYSNAMCLFILPDFTKKLDTALGNKYLFWNVPLKGEIGELIA
jgi:hypothetical protein